MPAFETIASRRYVHASRFSRGGKERHTLMTIRSILPRTSFPRTAVAAMSLSTIVLTFAGGCNMMNRSKPATQPQKAFTGPSFGDDVAFLRTRERDLVVLTAHNGQSQVAISPKMQGRVMTSTATGDAGPGYGFINRELI